MLGFVAMTLIGAQVIQLGVFARTYARVRIGERDPLLERLGSHLSLERGLLFGGALALAAVVGLVAVGAEWASNGFGALGRAYETALLVTGSRARHPDRVRRLLPRPAHHAAPSRLLRDVAA